MSEVIYNRCHRADQTRDETKDGYNEICHTYNKLLVDLKYEAPRKCAELLAERLPNNKNGLKVLDMGCGTGLVAKFLKNLGFDYIDGVDPSEGMLEEAKATGFYNQLICTYIGVDNEKIPLQDDSYDAVTICGAMGPNMVPCGGLHEMVRLVKSGGYVVNLFREEILSTVPEYKDRLVPLMEKLEKEGKWKLLSRQPFQEYLVDRIGVAFIHQIC